MYSVTFCIDENNRASVPNLTLPQAFWLIERWRGVVQIAMIVRSNGKVAVQIDDSGVYHVSHFPNWFFNRRNTHDRVL